ncbi:DUF2075 domain-containing protein [Butyrivibrio sp. WCD2001]|uniref:DUF2075 domain-containing protein n=1 Tax=Butyrivibrio sp. WCD2001 TaxID=1280681 RepID=UPI0004007008|nr:DUF2075 domain-containing protein [Butyrivibrio sp. WCD2001]
MVTIKTFEFSQEGKAKLAQEEKGTNWPVVYLLYNDKTLYIGEASDAARRLGEHLINPKKAKEKLKWVKVIFDDTFNKSVVLDYEQQLIKWCKADGKFKKILNANDGQSDAHDYYQRADYSKYLKDNVWPALKKEKMVNKDAEDIINENLFKYSPYNTLTLEQKRYENEILEDVFSKLENNEQGIYLINGCAGTGKTVLAIHMIYQILHESEQYIKDYQNRNGKVRIGLIFPMNGVRGVIADVFKESGDLLNRKIIITPYALKQNDDFKKYDLLFVDESHRLAKRKSLSSMGLYANYDKVCKSLLLDKDKCNQLDWVLEQAKCKILFYDKDQSIKSSDITYDEYQASLKRRKEFSNKLQFTLSTQLRCQGGSEYIQYIKNIMSCDKKLQFTNINNYDFKLYYDADKMISDIRNLDIKEGLCKTVAGYSWDWKTQPENKNIKNNMDYYNKLVAERRYDIDDIGRGKYIWNVCTDKWITREDSHFTIGCIHSTQGIDMNYVGVILGKEIDYDKKSNEIKITREKFKDKMVKTGVKDDDVLKQYILNAYVTMMLRGIKGCYVYAYNKGLRDYLAGYIRNVK